MASWTKDKIVCDCGHEGFLTCKESDQPYGRNWEDYRLEGFAGEDYMVNRAESRLDILAKTKPVCPICGEHGKVSYA